MAACNKCLVEHFPLSETTGMCLGCGMKAKKKADIKAFIEKNVKKTEIPLEPIEPAIIDINSF